MADLQDKDVRSMMIQALQKYNIKQVDVARQTGVHHSTLSLWLQGKVSGHQIKIEETLSQWLNNLYGNKPRYTALNRSNNMQHQLCPSALSFKLKQEMLNLPEILVPVHLDFEMEGKKFKGSFLWNINQPYMTPEDYSRLLIEQNSQLQSYEQQITDTIKKAIAAHRPYQPKDKEQCIRVLQLDIHYDNIILKDQFQWDINNPDNNPEEFAADLCHQLQLSSQFCVKIAHQIRQQIEYYQRNESGYTTGIMRGEPIGMMRKTRNLIELGHGHNQQSAVSSLNYIRSNTEEEHMWQPRLQMLNPDDVHKLQKVQERKHRYTRRNR